MLDYRRFSSGKSPGSWVHLAAMPRSKVLQLDDMPVFKHAWKDLPCMATMQVLTDEKDAHGRGLYTGRISGCPNAICICAEKHVNNIALKMS